MVKAYQRYALASPPGGSLGVITSSVCGDVLWADGTGTTAMSATLDAITLWNLRTGVQVGVLREEGCEAEVSAMALSGNRGTYIAAGHTDGKVRLWGRATLQMHVALDGHKSAVTTLKFNHEATMLASGSADTDIIVWDVVAEVGMFRLRGHKGAVTSVAFMSGGTKGLLVSSSKDALVKIWELAGQHCVQTLVGHRSEVWSVAVDLVHDRLITGGADGELRLWNIHNRDKPRRSGKDGDGQIAVAVGAVPRAGAGRVGRLCFVGDGPGGQGGSFIMCQTREQAIQIYRLRSKEEAVKKMRRRLKRLRDKEEKAAGEEAEGGEGQQGEKHLPTAADELQAVALLTAGGKVRAADVVWWAKAGEGGGGRLKVVAALASNALEMWELDAHREAEAPALKATVAMPGHRTDVRAVAISEDESMAVACAGSDTKVWNLASGQCFRAVHTSYAVCCAFAPGDKYVLLGCKSGELQVVDIARAEVAENVAAHEGAVWAMAQLPEGRGIVTAGADKEVKFWEFDVVEEEGGGGRLGLRLGRSVTMEDDVLSVAVTANGKLLAMSLLDGTVRVVFADSLGFFLSLYGHRLPVLCLDVSSDSTLLVSGSADKNVKIWGLDFGDCHKSMLAHQDNVMAVKFVPRTHYFFSAGKDKAVKMWDADKFEQVYAFRAHYAEVWCLAVARSGDFLLSGSHDRSLRVWQRTQEQVFIEEERQKELEALMEEEENRPAGGPPQEGEESGPAGPGGRVVLDAVDRLQEALDLCRRLEDKEVTEMTRLEALGMGASDYFLHVLRSVRRGHLEAALLQLPLEAAVEMLRRTRGVLAERPAAHVELLARCAVALVRLHHGRLSSGVGEYGELVRGLRRECKRGLQAESDQVGFNLAALRRIKQRLADA